MNRIEQIIGRGVRNQSHCGLPFEQRNVEIYLHGTILENGEEAADLYVYRLAERKAIQIGRVTRLLKETAVDCNLNIAQTNFTQDKLFENIENKMLKIELSSGKQIDFKVGDLPHTDVCDYMNQCEYKCNPEMTDETISWNTYDSEFSKMNRTQIMKRISDLFLEQVVYNRDQLKKAITIQRNYPDEQIYDALTQFIKNKNNVLIDKYGRKGYMINRGAQYIFQPNEITDESASIFERSIPVDYKRSSIVLDLPNTFETGEPDKETTSDETRVEMNVGVPVEPKQGEINITYSSIISKIEENLLMFTNEETISVGETNWYRHARTMFNILTEFHKIPATMIDDYILHHSIDCLSYNEKCILIENITEIVEKTKLENKIMDYLNDKKVVAQNIVGYLIANGDRFSIYLKNSNNIWQNAHKEDERKFMESLKKFVTPRNKMYKYVGFMHPFKQNEMVFKMKDLQQRRNNKGAWCNQAQKGDIMNILNAILETTEPVYTIENVDELRTGEKRRRSKRKEYRDCVYKMGSDVYIETREIERKCITKNGLCIILEILMRHFNKSDIVYFFDPEYAVMNNIVNI
jgi:hypothetical protein